MLDGVGEPFLEGGGGGGREEDLGFRDEAYPKP